MKLRINGHSRGVRVVRRGDQLTVQFDDGEDVRLRLLSSGDGRFELEHGHARIHGAGAIVGRKRQVWVNGRTLAYERESPGEAGRETANDQSLCATIPSVVAEVLVEAGEKVGPGQRLVLLESMKMVVPIQAPYGGTVRAVHCAAGDSVAAGVTLVEVEPEELHAA